VKLEILKNLLTLILILINFSLLSQTAGRDRRVILIRNNKTFEFTRLSKNLLISAKTLSGDYFSGKISRIRSDTIFLQDTMLRISDIDTIIAKIAKPDPP
jgi:hypothetical protein